MIVTAILNFPPLPRFEDLCARLLSYESQLLRTRTKPTNSTGSTTALVTTESSIPTANITHGPSPGRGQSRGNGCHGRRGNFRGSGHASWHSSPDYSNYGSGHGYYWPQQNSGRGLLGSHPSQAQASQWCSTCYTHQHSYSNCPHQYHGPESLTAPFAGLHVAQYPPPPDFTWYPDTGATHHMTSTTPLDSITFNGNTSVLLGNGDSLPIINTVPTLAVTKIFATPAPPYAAPAPSEPAATPAPLAFATSVQLVPPLPTHHMTTHHADFIALCVDQLGREFDVKDLGSLRYFLGLKVNSHLEGLHISQVKYTLDLLHHNSMSECKPCSTPMTTNMKLTADGGDALDNAIEFRQLVLVVSYLDLS
ncbi:hypothetical protein LWI29_032390 [Acer saccharum]|uniref:Reverse transcriptase Ty1/copia-type domain-containing protein n=1 Tax=Acer saccharum TaxID=4024 RepID=A0AA39S6X0_ACESA|nr:hypothetical protein LWI29_032390 [Acer saccharum]